jgi:fructosamine-3-kinase
MIDLQPDLELTIPQAERILRSWLGTPSACSAVEPLKGGLVNSVFRLEFDRPPFRAVVKIHGVDGNTFTDEARALEFLAEETSCPVPRMYRCDDTGVEVPYAFLLLEHLDGVTLQTARVDGDERQQIDAELAGLLGGLHGHKGTGWGMFGEAADARHWGDIFAERLAEVRASPGLDDRLPVDVLRTVDAAIERCAPALADAGVPTLIHGDVWDGNLLVRRDADRWQIVGLLDPKLQFADVEMELAYLEVFDNRRDVLFEAYTGRHPLRPGYERRRRFYWLETALEHVALFDEQLFRDFTARTAAEIVDDR